MSIFKFFKPKKTNNQLSSKLDCPEGFFLPQPAAQLLNSKERMSHLQTLWDYSSLPAETYELFYKKPLSTLAELMQNFPGPNEFSRVGGMLDRTLMLVAYSARIAKQYMLPIGATPEEQSAQSTAWHAIIIYKAIYESIRPFSYIYVQTLNGLDWRPFKPLTEPFRFRVNSISLTDEILVFNQLLTSDFLVWITRWPNVYETFLNIVNDSLPDSDIVAKIVAEALLLIEPNSQVTSYSLEQLDQPAETIANRNSDDNSISSSNHKQDQSNTFSLSSAFDEPEEVNEQANLEDTVDLENTPISEQDDKTDPLKFELISLLSPDSEVITSNNNDNTELDSSSDLNNQQSIDNLTDCKNLTPKQLGQYFLDWMVQSISTGELTLNSANSFIHVSSGYLLVRSPNIFSRFIRTEKSLSNDDRKKVQAGFERLEIHKQGSKSIFSAIMTLDDGNILKLNGYLIPISFILKNYLHFNLNFIDNSCLVLQ